MSVADPISTEQYRHECECRMVAALPSDERRKQYLDGVEKRRGSAAALRLRKDVWRTMNAGEEVAA